MKKNAGCLSSSAFETISFVNHFDVVYLLQHTSLTVFKSTSNPFSQPRLWFKPQQLPCLPRMLLLLPGKMAGMLLSHAHERSWRLFMLSGLGKGPGTWTRVPQLLEDCSGHRGVCCSEVPLALRLTARRHSLSKPKALLGKGLALLNVSGRCLCFLMKTTRFAERFPNGLCLKVSWKKEARDLLLMPPDECSLSGFGIKNGAFILPVTSPLRFYAFL